MGNAIQTQSISQRIADMDELEALRAIKILVEYICKDLGVKAPQGEEERFIVVRIWDMTQKYYRGVMASDIKRAFEWLMVGKLDDHLPLDKSGSPDRNHYGVFSIGYWTKVMNAYLALLPPMMVEPKREEPLLLEAPPEDKVKQALEGMKKVVRDHFALVVKGQGMPFFSAYEVEFLAKYGLTPPDSDEDYEARAKGAKQSEMEDYEDRIDRIMNKGDYKWKINLRIVEYKLTDIYQMVHMDGKHIDDYIGK
jgi:hypothetical protein